MRRLIFDLVSRVLSSRALLFLRRFLGPFLTAYLRTRGEEIKAKLPPIGRVIDLANAIRQEVNLELQDEAAELVYLLALISATKMGDMAEVGVYQGGSAKLICEVKGDKPLHLFDTFEGHPEGSNIDKPFYEGQYKAPLEKVKRYLAKYKSVYFHRGLFFAIAETVRNRQFSFVHLDVDLYKSTLDCLEFFYPRMERGGIILSHDYPSATGVKKAFDEFFEDKLEPIIRISNYQCLIVKM